MTRDEWMVLPSRCGNGVPAMLRRSAVIAYGEETNNGRPTGKTWVQLAGASAHSQCDITVAEFEALLFGPAEGDEYTRAAVAYAEAHAAVMNLPAFDPELEAAYRRIRDPFLRLYRERHDAQR